LTWRQLDELSSRVANSLLGAGVGHGDRVAVLSRNNAEFFEVAFGAAKIGAVTVGLNWRLTPAELSLVLADAEPAVLFVDADSAGQVPASAPRVLQYGFGYEQWRDAAPAEDPERGVAASDVAYLLYSSGTTGLPKGVALTHENLAHSALMAVQGFRMDADTVHMCAGPQFHIAGAGTGLMAMFLGGRTVVIADPAPAHLIATIARERVTHAFLVPALIQAVLDCPERAGQDLTSLQQVSYGAAPMTEALLRRAMDELKCTFLGVYGMTETAGTVTTLLPEEHEPTGERSALLRSVGRPLPWVDLRVADTVTGEDVAPGEIGEIWVRSRQVTPGYWRQPETTAATITADGWLRTGDGAYRDAEGYVYLKDRIKDMIISGGENVYPAEVENALADHPDISEVAVIGVPHERWGETVKAVVVLRPGVVGDAEAIRAFAKERIASYKCPTSVEFVEALPRNPSGKVLKKDLRATYAG
ncbi:MAG TPA: long-chain-fatty-acid--CoA ligase, partial [Sporichthya sp.]|nr:long-chain-fatty-acid--CoA ligase [Sporichthya sp.]